MEHVEGYLDREKKGYVTFQELHDRLHSNIVNDLNKTNLPTLLQKTTAKGGWLSTKRTFIQSSNKYGNTLSNAEYNAPSKYSAWPSHLTTPDLSLIQPPSKSGMFSTEYERFNTSQKDSFAQECKQRARSIQEAKYIMSPTQSSEATGLVAEPSTARRPVERGVSAAGPADQPAQALGSGNILT